MLCARLGAPLFLGASLVAWGAVAACFATLRSAAQFYALRFTLGLVEAAAYPSACARLTRTMSCTALWTLASRARAAAGSEPARARCRPVQACGTTSPCSTSPASWAWRTPPWRARLR